MSRVAVFNQKGGVGKTTTALNISAALHQQQSKNLIIDMDPQSHLTDIHQKEKVLSERSLFDFYKNNTPLSDLTVPWENLGHIIPSHSNTLEAQEKYDNIIIDCCPYLGVLSLSAIFAADLVIVPIASDFLSLKSAQKIDKTLKALERVLKKRVDRRYVLTMFDKRRKMPFEVLEQAKALFGEDLCETTISANVALAESPYHQQDIFRYQKGSKGAEDYHALTLELAQKGLLKA